MAGRRIQWQVAACEAVLRGEKTVRCFGKTGEVTSWLSAEQMRDAKTTLAELKAVMPDPKTLPPKNRPKSVPIPPKNTEYKPKGDICFIIANGESRRGFDLNKLKGKGYIMGMNVLPLRENFWPDALISVDIATVKYICERDVPDRVEMWTYPRGGIKDPRPNRIAKDWGWSSGPTTTRIALEYKKFQTIYILGMDFFGIQPDGTVGDEKDGRRLNNMYKGTDRYRKENSDRTYFGNWLNQMIQNTTKHANATFYHIIQPKQKSPNKLAQKTNWIDINYSVFEEHLQKMPKKSS